LGGVFVFCLGLVDDIWHIKPWQKLLGQIIAALMLLALSPALRGPACPISMAWSHSSGSSASPTPSIFSTTWTARHGHQLDRASFFAMVLLQLGQQDLAIYSGALAAALAGFLVYNSNPASIFMGDCGALFIGYVLSAIALQTAHALRDYSLGERIAVPVSFCSCPFSTPPL